MNILFISKEGSSLGLAERVKLEGHKTYFYLLDNSKIGNKIVDKPHYTATIMTNDGFTINSAICNLLDECDPDLVVFGNTKMGRVADHIRREGIAVFGACRWADNAEIDIEYGHKLMKQVGIQTFQSDKKGIEIDCGLWWNGIASNVYNITYKDTHFMNDGIGPNIGCSGNVVKMVSNKSKIFKEGIGKMERLLKKITYKGPITLTSLITPSELYGIKFTVHFNYDSLQSLMELYRGNVTKLLWSIARSTPIKGDFSADYSIAVRVSIPPYPNKRLLADEVEVNGVASGSEKHIWWKDICKNGKKEYKCAGTTGELFAATARGRDVMECRKRVYRTISNLSIQDKQYRTDIGLNVGRDEHDLKDWGWF